MHTEVLKRENLPGESFPIISCGGDERALAAQLSELIGVRRALLCTTPTVARLFGDILASVVATAPANIKVAVFDFSEDEKSLRAVCDVAEAAKDFGIGRRDLLVAIGGGVCSDIVRVAAGLIRRGVPHICVPTTLIGQIDAGIGIKGAVNFDGSKSYLGLFYPPEAAVIWPTFLHTLSPGAWRDGLAEAIKLACIADAGLFDAVAEVAKGIKQRQSGRDLAAVRNTVQQSIAITVSELALDPREEGSLERFLDLGHTFSPLIETHSAHSISHGRAVAIDICYSTMIAKCLGLIEPQAASSIVEYVAAAGLPVDCDELDHDLVRDAIAATVKHRNGKLNLVVPIAVGRCAFVRDAATLTDALIGEALRELKAWRVLPAPGHQDRSRGVVNAEPSMLMSMTTSRTV